MTNNQAEKATIEQKTIEEEQEEEIEGEEEQEELLETELDGFNVTVSTKKIYPNRTILTRQIGGHKIMDHCQEKINSISNFHSNILARSMLLLAVIPSR